MKKSRLFSLLSLVALMASSQAALAFIPLDLPQPVAVPTSNLYICSNGPGESVAVSVAEMQLFMMETDADTEGLPMQLSDLVTARCPHTFSFKVNLMGDNLDGALTSGCDAESAGGGIQLSLTDPSQPAESLKLQCTFKP
ncbi:MAG: hypothetical protein J0L82_14395 [Deltaproteobacteria bacterium]|jgi:hypothetical protein|nr:hypothetical protein [Deltaproteobacteria bacterium]